MFFHMYNPVNLIVEISELFQEILKLAAVEGIITSWSLEIRLENVKSSISTDHQEEQFRCLHALNSFILKAKLFEVRRVGNQSFQCGLCGRIYSRMVKVLEHYLTHTGEKPWQCGNCDKKFRNSYSLQKHNRAKHVTDQLQIFSCKVCQKTFGIRSALQTHLATHSATKPFICSICGRTFALKFTRDSHEFQHTGKRPWSCNVCGKSYITKYKLKAHAKAHTGELICNICGHLFGSQDALTRHKKRHDAKTECEATMRVNNRKSKQNLSTGVAKMNDSDVKYACQERSKNIIFGNSSNNDSDTSEFRCQMCNQVFLKSTCLTHHLASCNALTYCPPAVIHLNSVDDRRTRQSSQHQVGTEIPLNQEQSHPSLTAGQHLEKDHLFPLYELSVSESIVASLDNRPFALDPISAVPSSSAFRQNDALMENPSQSDSKVLPDFLHDVAFGNPT